MALTQVSSAGIKNAEVKTEDILDANITTAKIAADAITAAKIADDAIGAEHIELLDAPLHIADATNLVIGTGSDLKLWHYSDHSYIRNETGNLTIEANSAGDDAIKIIPDGAVELYHNNVEMFYTSASGCHVGRPSAAAHLHFLDGGIARFGSSNDLEIYHDASNGNSFITESGSGSLVIKATNTIINSAADEQMISATADGAVELYYDGTRACYTASNALKFDDNKKAIFGGQLTQWHSGSHSFIENGAGNLYIYSKDGHDGHVVIQATYGEESIICEDNGAVKLYYDNSTKFETTSAGSTLYGALTVTNEINLFNGTTNASRYIDAGLGDDNSLVFRGCSGGDANHETLAQFQRNGAVELYHDNTKVFRTTSSGFNIGTHTGGQCLNQFNSGWSEFADDTDSGNIAVNTNVFLFVSAQKSAGPTTNYPTAIFHMTYTGDITRLSQSADVFSENTDTDGKICVFKQANGQFRVKNRTGVNNKIGITVLHAQGV